MHAHVCVCIPNIPKALNIFLITIFFANLEITFPA